MPRRRADGQHVHAQDLGDAGIAVEHAHRTAARGASFVVGDEDRADPFRLLVAEGWGIGVLRVEVGQLGVEVDQELACRGALERRRHERDVGGHDDGRCSDERHRGHPSDPPAHQASKRGFARASTSSISWPVAART